MGTTGQQEEIQIDPRLKEVHRVLASWLDRRKVGNVTVNFFKGGISSVKLEETIKLGGNNHET